MIISSRSPLGFLGKIPRNTRPKLTAPGGVAALSAAKSVVDIHDNVGRYDAVRTEKGDKWKRRQRGETKEKEEKRGAKKHRGDGRMEPQVSRRTVRAATLSLYRSFQTTSRERVSPTVSARHLLSSFRNFIAPRCLGAQPHQ